MTVAAVDRRTDQRGPFDFPAWLADRQWFFDLLADTDDTATRSEIRRQATRGDLLLFAYVYLRHHITDRNGQVSLADWHADLLALSEGWAEGRPQLPKADRDAFVAPRESGKSTWLFTILPLWCAAHGHHSFIAALADSATQAEDHLRTFTLELEGNDLLRLDFPDLCAPLKRQGRNRDVADNKSTTMRANGLVFMARGLDSSVLGMKLGERRPDLIVLDDVEPGESKYSVGQVEKRLKTLQDVVLPLSEFARVLLAGTVTMAGSIVHQLVSSVTRQDQPEEWVAEERFRVHYYPALYQKPDGTWASVWEQKWPVGWLLHFACSCGEQTLGDPDHPGGKGERVRRWVDAHKSGTAHQRQGDGSRRRGAVIEFRMTRTFRKNYQNRPVASDGTYWTPDEIVYGEPDVGYGNTLLWIDPAVTDKGTSDYYGFAVVGRDARNRKGKVWVRYATRARLSPAAFRARVDAILSEFPDIGVVILESNQGGDLWRQFLGDLPVRYKLVHSDENKEVRIARAHQDYQRFRVEHVDTFDALEDEMFAFPNVLHDDTVDAVTGGVLRFLDRDRPQRRGKGRTSASYV